MDLPIWSSSTPSRTSRGDPLTPSHLHNWQGRLRTDDPPPTTASQWSLRLRKPDFEGKESLGVHCVSLGQNGRNKGGPETILAAIDQSEEGKQDSHASKGFTQKLESVHKSPRFQFLREAFAGVAILF